MLQQTLRDVGFELHGYVAPRDVDSRLAPTDEGVEVEWLGYDANLLEFDRDEHLLVNGIGSAGSLHVRKAVFDKFTEAGFNFLQIVADTAIVSDSANMLEGVQVLTGAIVGVDAFIDEDTIVNTGAIIEHDAVIGRHAAFVAAHFARPDDAVDVRFGHALEHPHQEIVQALPVGLLVDGEVADGGGRGGI